MNSELQENDLSDDNKEVVKAILKTFYKDDSRPWTECILEFNALLRAPSVEALRLNLDFEKRPARYYIIADTYLGKADIVSLYNHLSGKQVRNITVQFAERVKNEFLQSVAYFRDLYEWIYNPPTIGKIGKYTEGKMLRTEFQQYYGAYAEITYLLAKGDAMKFDEVNNMPLSEYLAKGEYLIRKRAVEGVE